MVAKPVIKTEQYYDYFEVIRYIEDKYGFKADDYFGRFSSRDKVTQDCLIELNINKSDLEEDLISADKSDPEVIRKLNNRTVVYGLVEKRLPEYASFWDWVMDNQEIHNGSIIYFYKPDISERNPDFVNTILTYLLTEFGSGENQNIAIKCSW